MLQTQSVENQRNRFGPLYVLFCIYTIVIIGRPQDIFPVLAPLRPVLVTELITFLAFLVVGDEFSIRLERIDVQYKLFIFLFIIMIMGIPFSYYSRSSFMFIFGGYVNIVVFFHLFYKLVHSEQRSEYILLFCCIGVGTYSVFSILNGFFVKERIWFGDVFDPNDLACFILSFMFFNFLFINKNNRVFKNVIFAMNLLICLLVVLLTGSRGGFLALIVSIMMLVLSKSYFLHMQSKIIFVVSMVLLVSFNYSNINFERYQTLANLEDDYNTWDERGRLTVWETGLRLMFENPLTGVGVACFGEAIGRDREERGLKQMWQAPHNSLVQIGTETGILGFILFSVISFNAFKTFGRVKREACSLGLAKIGEMARVGFVGHCISSFFLSQAYSVYWAFYIVLSASLNRILQKEKLIKQ